MYFTKRIVKTNLENTLNNLSCKLISIESEEKLI